jgi:hypothetical protein
MVSVENQERAEILVEEESHGHSLALTFEHCCAQDVPIGHSYVLEKPCNCFACAEDESTSMVFDERAEQVSHSDLKLRTFHGEGFHSSMVSSENVMD